MSNQMRSENVTNTFEWLNEKGFMHPNHAYRANVKHGDKARHAVIKMCPLDACKVNNVCAYEICRLRPPLDEIAQSDRKTEQR